MEENNEYKNKPVSRKGLFLFLTLVFVAFILLYIFTPIDKFSIIADSFNKIAIGISALGAIIFVPSFVSTELEKDRKIKEYLKRFAHDKFGEDWEIIESEKYPGAIYVLETKHKIKHHILNMKTVWDLGWHIYPRRTIKDPLFQSYKVGDRIRTQGEAGE